jgi:hypothetical protein
LVTNRATLAPCASDIPEPFERGLPGLRFRHAVRHQLAAAHREMKVELRVDFFVDTRTPEA